MRIARCSFNGSMMTSGRVSQILTNWFRRDSADASWFAVSGIGITDRSSRLDCDQNSVLWSQRHCRINLNRMTFDEFETQFLTDCCEHQDNFHHCERRTNAGPRTAAEREVRILRESFIEFIGPAFRNELIRTVVEACVALRDPLK